MNSKNECKTSINYKSNIGLQKKLAKIPSQLISEELSGCLKLKEPPYIILVPKSIIQKLGIFDESLDFDLVINENKITLVGPPVNSAKENVIE